MPRVFISYRREDSSPYAGRIYDRLVSKFGVSNVFMDIDTLEPGVDFVQVVQRTVESSDVCLAVIGKQWLTAIDEAGRPRLSDPEDFVAREIAEALARPNTRVVPILVGGARMPLATELPPKLADLTKRQALSLPDIGFHQALGRLIDSIERAEQERLAQQESESAEQERLARQQAEAAARAAQEALAREWAQAAERGEQERRALENAEAAQRAEQERLAREKAVAAQQR